MYKIVTKTIANRLKHALKDIISESRSAFVQGRLITDNIIIGHECINVIRNHRNIYKDIAALKIDISKACDRVEWIYLKENVLRLGFDNAWVELILRCISSTSFTILLINGEQKGNFGSNRGLRQGDPLSPYLFLLVAEGLSHLIVDANNNGNRTGMVCSNGPLISHLLFTNDSLIFCKANEQQLIFLKNLLKIYEEASGECVNFSKSAITFSKRVSGDKKDFLSNILGVKKVDDFGKYLGIPSMLTKNKTKNFGYVMDKIWKSLQGWKRSLFSIAGKEILITNVGQAIRSYVMSVFKFPKKLCDEIIRVCLGDGIGL